MGDPPLTPYSPGALQARRAAARRRRARRRAVAAVAAVLLIAPAIVVLLARVSGPGATARAGRRLEASVQPASRRPSPATARANAARELLVHEDEAIDRVLQRQPFIAAGGSERREIALTFDDGPGPYTPRLLDELERVHVPATFFEIGFMFRWFHGSITRELRMGDVIGDHTETHPMMAQLSLAAQPSEILDQTGWVRKYGGPFPRLWRPPYGSYNAQTLAILHQGHMLMVLWTVETDDYLRPGVGVIVHNALAGARPGAIILMHDAGGDRSQTIAALPLIVHALRKRGYKLVTVPQLILDDPPRQIQHLPARLGGD